MLSELQSLSFAKASSFRSRDQVARNTGSNPHCNRGNLFHAAPAAAKAAWLRQCFPAVSFRFPSAIKRFPGYGRLRGWHAACLISGYLAITSFCSADRSAMARRESRWQSTCIWRMPRNHKQTRRCGGGRFGEFKDCVL